MASALIIVVIVGVGMLVLNFTIWKIAGARRAKEALPEARARFEQHLGQSVIDFAGAQYAGEIRRGVFAAWGRGLGLAVARLFGVRSASGMGWARGSDPSAPWLLLVDTDNDLYVYEYEMEVIGDEVKWSVGDELARISHEGLAASQRTQAMTTRLDLRADGGETFAFEIGHDPVGHGRQFADYLEGRYPGDLPALAELDRAQTELGDVAGGGWHRQITPPLPLAWPAGDDRGAVIYAYGMRHDHEHLRDAVLISRPYSRVVFDPRGQTAPQGQPLTDDLGDGEPQGVRPLRAEEIEVHRRSRRAEGELLEALAGAPAPELDATITEYYRLWLSTHGAVSRALRPYHEDFFAAVQGS